MSAQHVSKKTCRVSPLTRPVLRAGRSTAIIFLIALLATALFTASSAASLRGRGGRNAQPAAPAPRKAAAARAAADAAPARPAVARGVFPALLPQLTPTDSVTTYAADCTTPKSSFVLGDTVCATTTGAAALSIIPRRLALIDAAGNVRDIRPVTADPQNISFTLPSTQTTTEGTQTFDNRGTWRINSVPGSRLSVKAGAFFTVSDPAARVADLALYNSNNTDGQTSVGTSGTAVTFGLWVTNYGPDAATNVQVTDPVPAGTTFVSGGQDSGPTFNCTNPTGTSPTATCTIASLAPGESAKFSFVYLITGSTAAGTVISNTGSIASVDGTEAATAEAHPEDNSETSTVTIISGAAESCTLICPSDISRSATTTQGSVRGTFVTFSPEASGDCGTITSSPASGSFFPVGTTTVSVSSGSSSCSFNVTVTDDAPPTISCPANKSVTAAPGDCDAVVDPGTPTFTGTDAAVEGERDDGRALAEPYPGGVTTITWTVTDSHGQTATCTQTVTVTVDDHTPPTITAPPDVTIGTGPDATLCAVFVAEDRLGTPDADDNCPTSVKVTRSGVPAGNVFPKGTTTITWTATDGGGNIATATQHVTVVDNTVPIIYAPADASYTCLDSVPAASPAQAGGPVVDSHGVPVLDGNGNLVPGGAPFDNCGAPVVTVSQTSTGAGTVASPKVIKRTFTATDGSGNQSSAVQTITVIDPTPPVISCPANITVYLPLHTTATSTTVTYTAPVGTDNCAGATTAQTTGLASGASFPVGTTVNTFVATDAVGNTASCSFTVTVLYDFTGFFAPVSNLPTLNSVNAGRAIPTKFSLSGNKGLGIFPAGTPDSQQITCDTGVPISNLEDTVTAGGSSLSYDSGSDQYNYVWKTEGSWAGTCRQLVVTLNDGSTHVAKFKFK